MTKNSDTSPWMRFPDNPGAIKRHNELVLSSIPTTYLVTELKNRHELCPVVDEMTREPVCLCVMTTESLVKELSKRDGVGYHIIRNSFEIKRGTCESPKLESHWQEVKYDGPITVLVVRE